MLYVRIYVYVLTHDGERGVGAHGLLDGDGRVVGLARVGYTVVLGRRRYVDRALRVVLLELALLVVRRLQHVHVCK